MDVVVCRSLIRKLPYISSPVSIYTKYTHIHVNISRVHACIGVFSHIGEISQTKQCALCTCQKMWLNMFVLHSIWSWFDVEIWTDQNIYKRVVDKYTNFTIQMLNRCVGMSMNPSLSLSASLSVYPASLPLSHSVSHPIETGIAHCSGCRRVSLRFSTSNMMSDEFWRPPAPPSSSSSSSESSKLPFSSGTLCCPFDRQLSNGTAVVDSPPPPPVPAEPPALPSSPSAWPRLRGTFASDPLAADVVPVTSTVRAPLRSIIRYLCST